MSHLYLRATCPSHPITRIHPRNEFLNTTNYEPTPLANFCILVPTQPPILRAQGFFNRSNVAEALTCIWCQ